MTYASTTARRGMRLVTQLVIAGLAIAATVLFSCALVHSATDSARTGHQPTAVTTTPPRPDPGALRP